MGRSDARAVYQVLAAQGLVDVGEVVVDEAEIVADWQRPSFDLNECRAGVFAGERLVGYAEVTSTDRGDAAVHPEFRGRGVGWWLGRMDAEHGPQSRGPRGRDARTARLGR